MDSLSNFRKGNTNNNQKIITLYLANSKYDIILNNYILEYICTFFPTFKCSYNNAGTYCKIETIFCYNKWDSLIKCIEHEGMLNICAGCGDEYGTFCYDCDH